MLIKLCSEVYFSGLKFFNEPEISDSGSMALSPSWRTCVLRIFTFWKIHRPQLGLNPQTLNFEASMLHWDHRGRLKLIPMQKFLFEDVSIAVTNIEYHNCLLIYTDISLTERQKNLDLAITFHISTKNYTPPAYNKLRYCTFGYQCNSILLYS